MRSSVTLGNSLDLILLSDSEGVGLTNTLGGGDDLISEGLGHGLVASEGGLSGTLANEVDSLVDSSEWGNINSLSSDGTTWTNSSGIFSGTTLNDSLEEDLEWVLSGKEVNDLESLSEDSHGHLLLTILSVVSNHELVDKSLDNWAGDLLETFFLIFTSSVWNIHLRLDILDWEVIRQRLLRALDSIIGPFAEKLSFHGESNCFFYTTKYRLESGFLQLQIFRHECLKECFCNDFLPCSAIFFTEIFLYIIIKKIRPSSI